MPAHRPILYLDTCAVIEAHRVGIWAALAGYYDCHTVREIWNELGRGNPKDKDYVPLDRKAMEARITVHDVSRKTLAAAQLRCPALAALDAGERDLLAHCLEVGPGGILLTTGDKAAILAACALGFENSLISLEDLATKIGQRASLQPHYRRSWLSGVRTEYLMDHL